MSDYKGGYIWIFSVKSFGYMLNNIYFVAMHVLMGAMPSFAISSQGHWSLMLFSNQI